MIVRHHRNKYRCTCNGCVETAPAPPKLQSREDVRGHRYSLDFSVEVAIQTFLDHLPLERRVRIMRREGLEIDSQTLWDQTSALGGMLRPSHDALWRYVLSAEVLGADETWWRLMERSGSKRWRVWSLAREDAVVYRVLDSRSQDAGREALGSYRGIVIADGYGAYGALSRGQPGFRLAHGWAHVRRRYVEAEPHYPEPCQEILELIRALYGIESQVPRRRPDARAEDRDATLAVRAQRRGKDSRSVVKAIETWTLEQHVLPESTLGKAIA